MTFKCLGAIILQKVSEGDRIKKQNKVQAKNNNKYIEAEKVQRDSLISRPSGDIYRPPSTAVNNVLCTYTIPSVSRRDEISRHFLLYNPSNKMYSTPKTIPERHRDHIIGILIFP